MPFVMLYASLIGAGLAGAPTPAHALVAHAGCDHACHAHPDMDARIAAAIDAVASASPDPACASEELYSFLVHSPLCFPTDITQEQLTTIFENYAFRPPGNHEDTPTDRFVPDYDDDFPDPSPTSTLVWTGDGMIGDVGRAARAQLTYSFPNDGVQWGLFFSGGFQPAPNALNAGLTSTFGPNIDRGREYIRQSLAAWRKYSGITYTEVGDDNTSMTGSSFRDPARGDIRIGGIPLGQIGILAYNAFPTTAGRGAIGGGDMVLNTSYFSGTTHFASIGNDYRYFRNTVTHEHGHGLGYIHVVPCNLSKIMEPNLAGSIPGMSIDERRGAAYNYGDRFAGNISSATAANLGTLDSPSVRSVLERDLVLNRAGAPNSADQDWFRFTLTSPQAVSITADPSGGSYQTDEQDSGCTGKSGSPTPFFDAESAGDLALVLLDAAAAPIFTSDAGLFGGTENITQNLPAGTYYVRVYNKGSSTPGDTHPNRTTQSYNLELRLGSTPVSPWAIAGINKRVQANQLCYFNAVNSEPLEAGATIPPNGYAWDLDGDGVLETFGNDKPNFTYVSNGNYDVTLRVTDSNSRQDTDTIRVTVHGATTTLTEVFPASGARNSIVPVTIFGTNLKGVTSNSQFFVSGSGVSVTGTPVPSALGTEVTGISFIVSNSAALGARNVQIVNTDGMGASVIGVGVFTVTQSTIPANDECAGAVHWGSAPGSFAFSNVGATDSATQSYPSTGCPSSGPITADVWYRWTAPSSGTLTITNNSQAVGFSSRIAVYMDGCPVSTGTLLRCDDFGAAISLPVSAGTTYLLRAGSASTTTGSATITLSLVIPTGACCLGTTCSVMSSTTCTSGGGVYQGNSTSCGTFGNPTTCCPANFDGASGVNATDIFIFLDAWFTQNGQSGANLSADIDDSGTVDATDIFVFLDAWFAGC